MKLSPCFVFNELWVLFLQLEKCKKILNGLPNLVQSETHHKIPILAPESNAKKLKRIQFPLGINSKKCMSTRTFIMPGKNAHSERIAGNGESRSQEGHRLIRAKNELGPHDSKNLFAEQISGYFSVIPFGIAFFLHYTICRWFPKLLRVFQLLFIAIRYTMPFECMPGFP